MNSKKNLYLKLLFLILLFTIVVPDLFAKNSFRKDLTSNEITARGWVREFLHRQEDGLGSHPEESGFPFNTCMWNGNMNYKDEEYQYYRDPWWPYEHTAYYLDGSLRAGYILKSDNLLQRVNKNLEYVLNHADKNGMLHAGNIEQKWAWWPMVVFMRMAFEKYENTQDPKLLAALEKYYKVLFSQKSSFDLPYGSGFNIRKVLHVELLCQLYGYSGDKFFLNTAEKLYNNFQNSAVEQHKKNPNAISYQISALGMAKSIKATGHGVTYNEFLKLPAVLYLYTGKENYKKAVEGAYKQLKKYHELADGGYSAHENFNGKGPNEGYEACNVIDFGWATGWALLATREAKFADKMEKILYNAGFGLITKNFKAYQYYGMPNLLISMNSSNPFDTEQAWGMGAGARICYKPGHDTQCCAGNIHRMLPTFLDRACIVKDNNIDLVFYLPSTINIPLSKGHFSFTQNTEYPFKHNVEIVINNAPSNKVNFGLRIPGWADSYSIKLNGKKYISGTDNTFFKKISRRFKEGDIITIEFKTTPKIDNRGNGVAIDFGPLVFSAPIKYKELKITHDYSKKVSNDFPSYELYPFDEHKWAIALSKSIKPSDIKIINTESLGYPWDYGNSPIKLRVKAKYIENWNLIKWTWPSAYPKNPELGKDIILDLEPMGGTLLRITEFPKGDF